jgi:hypothetical protein
MPEQPPRLPRLGFAGFEDSSSARGHSRRKPRWALRPTREPSEGATADAGRFINEAELLQGLGRRKRE